MKFNRYIASRIGVLEWRHFGVGALQAYLFEGPSYEQRLHIWHESLIAPGIRGFGDMHNHRFSFTSNVLCGAIDDRRYNVTDSPEGDCDVYQVVNAREQKQLTGKFDGNVTLNRRANVELDVRHSRIWQSGSTYEFPRGAFHATRAIGTTVTLVTKYDVAPGQRAEIVVPHGSTLIHAFDESRKPNIPAVILEALKELSV